MPACKSALTRLVWLRPADRPR